MTLVEGLHLDGAFFVVDLNPQAWVLLVLLLFFHMIYSLFIWWLSIELVSANALVSLVQLMLSTLR